MAPASSDGRGACCTSASARQPLPHRCFELVTDLNLTDMETCYKMMTREVVKSLRLRSTASVSSPRSPLRSPLGFRVYEVPVSYHGRDYWEGKKKIGWKDGFAAIATILRYAFVDDEENERAGYRILRRMVGLPAIAGCGSSSEPTSVAVRARGRRRVGNMTRFLLRRERVIATDLDAKYLRISSPLRSYTHVTIGRFDLGASRRRRKPTRGRSPAAERIDGRLPERARHRRRRTGLANLPRAARVWRRLILLRARAAIALRLARPCSIISAATRSRVSTSSVAPGSRPRLVFKPPRRLRLRPEQSTVSSARRFSRS
jgi:hypothetical protein